VGEYYREKIDNNRINYTESCFQVKNKNFK